MSDQNWLIDTLPTGAEVIVPVGATMRIARMRRGRWVPIPEPWRGKVAHPQTIRKRPSKLTRKQRRRQSNFKGERYKGEKRAPQIEEPA